MTDLDPKLDDANAQKVLGRALELQAQNAGALTEAQLREIASELSIPASAVDQALTEYRTAGVLESSSSRDAADAHTFRRRNLSARPVVGSLALVGGAFLLLTILYVVMRLFPSG